MPREKRKETFEDLLMHLCELYHISLPHESTSQLPSFSLCGTSYRSAIILFINFPSYYVGSCHQTVSFVKVGIFLLKLMLYPNS